MRSLSALLFSLFSLVPTGWAMAAEAAPRVVQVTGVGEVTVAPDLARLSMAIEARNVDLAAAEARVNTVTRAVLAELKGLGLKEQEISTAAYTVNAEYDWVDNQQRFRGYLARREVHLTLRDLAKTGDALMRVTRAGVTQVDAPVLESSQIKDAERAALARAVEDATQQARVIAEGMAVQLGTVRSVNASQQSQPPTLPMPRMAMVKMADGAETSGNEQTGFSAGLIRVRSTLSAEYELLP